MLLSKERWITVLEIKKVLGILNIAVVKLQSSGLTLSDAYGIWLVTKLKLEFLSGIEATKLLVKNLLASMKKRKPDVLETPLAVSAVYLDPRFKKDLTANEETLAKGQILKLWRKISNFKKKEEMAQTTSTSTQNDTLRDICNLPENEILDMYFHNDEADVYTYQSDNPNLDDQIFLELQLFADSEKKRIDSSINILKYWKDKKNIYPALYEVFTFLSTIPPTQVTVERSFSQLALIYNEKRSKLTEDMLEAILIINLNKEIAYEIFEKELQNIEETI